MDKDNFGFEDMLNDFFKIMSLSNLYVSESGNLSINDSKNLPHVIVGFNSEPYNRDDEDHKMIDKIPNGVIEGQVFKYNIADNNIPNYDNGEEYE